MMKISKVSNNDKINQNQFVKTISEGYENKN